MTKHDESYDPRPKTDELVGVMHAMWEQCKDDVEGWKCGEEEMEGGYGDMVHVDLAGMGTPSNVQRVETPIQKVVRRFWTRQSKEGRGDGDSGGKVGEHGGNDSNRCFDLLHKKFMSTSSC